MNRWLVRICVLLVLGAIVNVAVAWGIAVGIDITPFDWSDPLSSVESTQFIRSRYGQDAVDRSESIKGYGIHDLSRSAYMIAAVRGDRARSLSIWEYGVPMHAMRFELQGPWSRSEAVVQVGTLAMPGALSRWSSAFPAHLPTLPIWPGFAINTVFYAFVLWLLVAFGGTPFALRRWRRIKRGKCARCGYPWGTGAVCSECGSAIVGRTAAVHGARPIPPPATPGPPSDDRKHDA